MNASTQQWFISQNGKVFGPATPTQLRELAAKGKIDRNTNVRLGDNGQWMLASSVAGLFPPVVQTNTVLTDTLFDPNTVAMLSNAAPVVPPNQFQYGNYPTHPANTFPNSAYPAPMSYQGMPSYGQQQTRAEKPKKGSSVFRWIVLSLVAIFGVAVVLAGIFASEIDIGKFVGQYFLDAKFRRAYEASIAGDQQTCKRILDEIQTDYPNATYMGVSIDVRVKEQQELIRTIESTKALKEFNEKFREEQFQDRLRHRR